MYASRYCMIISIGTNCRWRFPKAHVRQPSQTWTRAQRPSYFHSVCCSSLHLAGYFDSPYSRVRRNKRAGPIQDKLAGPNWFNTIKMCPGLWGYMLSHLPPVKCTSPRPRTVPVFSVPLWWIPVCVFCPRSLSLSTRRSGRFFGTPGACHVSDWLRCFIHWWSWWQAWLCQPIAPGITVGNCFYKMKRRAILRGSSFSDHWGGYVQCRWNEAFVWNVVGGSARARQSDTNISSNLNCQSEDFELLNIYINLEHKKRSTCIKIHIFRHTRFAVSLIHTFINDKVP